MAVAGAEDRAAVAAAGEKGAISGIFLAQEAPPIPREIWVVPVALTYSAPLIKGVILPVINLESY